MSWCALSCLFVWLFSENGWKFIDPFVCVCVKYRLDIPFTMLPVWNKRCKRIIKVYTQPYGVHRHESMHALRWWVRCIDMHAHTLKLTRAARYTLSVWVMPEDDSVIWCWVASGFSASLNTKEYCAVWNGSGSGFSTNVKWSEV